MANKENASELTTVETPELDEAEKVADTVVGADKPMSLEDALAASERAASDLEAVSDVPKKSKNAATAEPVEEEEERVAATYNPDLLMADLEAEAPTIAEEAVENLIPEEKAEEMLEVAADEAESDLQNVENENIADVNAAVFPDIETVAVADEKEVVTVDSEELANIENTKVEDAEETPVNTAEKPVEKLAEAPAQEKPAAVEKAQKPQSKAKSAPTKKKAAPKAKTEVDNKVDNKPVDVAAEPIVAETPSPAAAEISADAVKEQEPANAHDDKKEKEKSHRVGKKKGAEKTVETPAEKPDESAEAAPKKEKRKRRKLELEKNFKLLKALIVFLSLLATAISGHIYFNYIFDIATGFAWYKFIPLIPFIVQVLLLLISLITVGTSKRKPIGATIKASAAEKKAVAAEKEEIRISKEIEDNLLVPEIELSPKKASELSNFQLDTFYKKNIEEINGKYYMQVAKFDDNVKVFSSRGATDMELVAVNMVGSNKFDEILDQPRTKTLSATELASYFLSKPGTFAIKKRGAIDWTFKYSSKSFGIIRENEDSYKVSIKCYPDAATKLNDVYKALEDSNFPSGPLWFCFNELRNLPPRVCKWLVDTSCQISQFQQIKTDVLKDDKTLADYDIYLNDIAAKFKAGQTVIEFPKFTMVFTKGADADLTTFLTREHEGVDASKYTKEFYYKFMSTNDAVSVLCPSKGVAEDVIICLFDNIEKIVK